MSKKKKSKIDPILISSREGMLAVVNNLVRHRLERAALVIRIEKIKARVTRKFQADIDELNRLIQMHEGGLQVWSKSYPAEFDGKKSIDLPDARFGFRTCPPKVEKAGGVGTWDNVLARLAATVIHDPAGNIVDGTIVFDGSDYIRDGAPSIDKEKLLADREKIPAQALALAGIIIEQDEIFFFDPKSEVLEATSQEAA